MTEHGQTARGKTDPAGTDTVRDDGGDVDLFARHLEGDHKALMALFDRHNRRLWLYCARMLCDNELASDAVQEIWERVIGFRGKEREVPKRPASFLFTMARNHCLNLLRSRKKLTSLDGLEESGHPQTSIYEPSRLEELVVIALERLPEAQREVLVLNAYSGYAFEEIADLLGKPRGAIHTMAWRARNRLGRILEELVRDEDERMRGGVSGEGEKG